MFIIYTSGPQPRVLQIFMDYNPLAALTMELIGIIIHEHLESPRLVTTDLCGSSVNSEQFLHTAALPTCKIYDRMQTSWQTVQITHWLQPW